MLVLLAACGTLNVQIQPGIDQTQPQPTSRVVTATPPSASPTPLVVTATVPTGLHLKPGEALKVTSIHMLDAALGWAVGRGSTDPNDHILRTTDGGNTWRDVSPSGAFSASDNSDKAAAAFFLDASHAWIAVYNRTPSPHPQPAQVWFTTDGGQNWTPSQTLDLANVQQDYYMPTGLGFADANVGWLMVHLGVGMSHDYVALFTTRDGGKSWKRVVDPEKNNLPMGCYKNGAAFIDADNGWVAGDCGGVMAGLYLYRTNDGGATWEQESLPAPSTYPDLYQNEQDVCGATAPVMTPALDGYLAVKCTFMTDGQNRRWLYTTADGGKTWTPHVLPLPYGDLEFISPQAGWLLGAVGADSNAEGHLYVTQDGGASWSPVQALGWQGQLDFIDEQNGWVVAEAGEALALVRTSNAGVTWQEIKPVVAP